MKNRIFLLALGLSVFIIMKSCVYHEFADISTSINTDQSLFDEVNVTGYQYYQNGSTLSPDVTSPHGLFKLRFNEIAWSSLDPNGEIPANEKFKEGSVIVKEVYQNNVLSLYAVMKKASSDPSAGDTWLWSEYALDGTPLFSIQYKGNACINCHSETPNRDLVRTFDLH